MLMVTHDVDEALLLADRIVMMTNGPAATVGEILGVPFERPRDRLSLSEDPMYHRLRGEMLRFLEARAPERAVTPAREKGEPSKEPAQLTAEEVFIIEKYTGFNRFRGKYRCPDTTAKRLVNSVPEEAKALG